jgi:L-alanine-DL-glutamate epimerase-like enolase superfamily enzyme
MRREDLEQLRVLALGEDPLDRERLFDKMQAATRGLFTLVGWFGAFDNCLWDIAGKVEGKPVCDLLGRVRDSCPAYYNFGGADPQAAAADAQQAVAAGYSAVKDHFRGSGPENETWFRAVREGVGADVGLLHDAAGCAYDLDEAIAVGRVLEELDYGWFEEPLPDRDQLGLQRLCAALSVPVLAPETMMNDIDLSRLWLTSGAVDMLRVNARHGMTAVCRLAETAAQLGTTVEANGPGGLFGQVHAHLVCSIDNTTYYEYFPDGSRDAAGREIGLLNPPTPQDGHIRPAVGPGWGAEWDRPYFDSRRSAVL